LLEFAVNEIRVGGRFYILLPKPNRLQIRTLADSLRRQGFRITGDSRVAAKSREQTIHISPSGLCWSRSDPADLVLPAIPRLLSAPKEAVSLEQLKRRYFDLKVRGSNATVRFEPRMEGGSLWKELRATGQCGLAPDERALLVFLTRHSQGGIDLLTDFPTPSSQGRVIGGKLYFDSRLDGSEFISTLRSTEFRPARQSYLPRSGILRLAGFRSPSRQDFTELFESLGEWCYLTPA
jgi:hypothetical protein